MNGVLPRDAPSRIEAAVAHSTRFKQVYANRDAQIYAFVSTGGGA
jgi:hypothetical protein